LDALDILGIRISVKEGECTVVDGPFAEAKDLVGGWALMDDLPGVVEWSNRFLRLLGEGEGEVRVRPVLG
jgi:hypothetical protein